MKRPFTGSATPGSGRAGLKRLKIPLKGGIEKVLTNPAIRRLARRAGVKRIGGGIGEAVQTALRCWLEPLIRAAVTRAEHARRFNVSLNDILLSLKNNALAGRGITLYGFEERARKRRQLTRGLPQQALATAHALAAGRQAIASSVGQQGGTEAVAAREEVEQQQQVMEPVVPQTAKPLQQQQAKEPAAVSSSPGPITPERSYEIQAELCNLWESMQRESEFEVPVPHALDWVATRLRSNGQAPCSPLEFETVLTALEHQNAVMLVEEAGRRRMLVFTA